MASLLEEEKEEEDEVAMGEDGREDEEEDLEEEVKIGLSNVVIVNGGTAILPIRGSARKTWYRGE